MNIREKIEQQLSSYGSELLAWKSWGINALEKTHDLKIQTADQIFALLKEEGCVLLDPDQSADLTVLETTGSTEPMPIRTFRSLWEQHFRKVMLEGER